MVVQQTKKGAEVKNLFFVFPLLIVVAILALAGCSTPAGTFSQEPSTSPSATATESSHVVNTTQAPSPAPSSTPSSTPTITQPPSPSPISNTVLYKDDFSDNSSGWEASVTAQWDCGYVETDTPPYYHVLLEQKMTKNVQNPNLGQYSDFSVAAVGMVDSKGINGGWGVYFRGSASGGDFYTFQISADGKYFLGKTLDGRFAWPIAWENSPLINQGANAKNGIKVECRGTEIRIWVNGQFLTAINDPSFTEGTVGLSTSTLGQPGASFRFFGFQITPMSATAPPSTETDSGQYAEPVSGEVTLSTKTVYITVLCFSSDQAKHVLDLYTKALPVLEDMVGVPFPPDYPIRVQEFTRTDLGNDAGINMGVLGLQIADTNIAYDATLLHEVSHYWFSSPRYEKWMSEGLATVYADEALRSIGETAVADQYGSGRISDYNRLRTLDFPLSEWTNQTGDLSTYAYGKSYVFLLNLYEKAGADAFKQVNRQVFATSSSKITSDSFLPSVSEASGQDFSYLGPGWIFPGEQQPFK